MDVGSNKTRKDTRAVVSLVARYRSPSTFEFVEEACRDISVGGMFIQTQDPAAPGTLLKLECETGLDSSIRGVARVVWTRTARNEYGPSGMGVKFVKLEPDSREVITRIVQELAESGVVAPSMSRAPEDRAAASAQRSLVAPKTPEPPLQRLSLPELPTTKPISEAPAQTPSRTSEPPQTSAPEPDAATDVLTQQPVAAKAAEPPALDSDRAGFAFANTVEVVPPLAAALATPPAEVLDATEPVAPVDLRTHNTGDAELVRASQPGPRTDRPTGASSVPPLPAAKSRAKTAWLVAAVGLAVGAGGVFFMDQSTNGSGRPEPAGSMLEAPAQPAEQAHPQGAPTAAHTGHADAPIPGTGEGADLAARANEPGAPMPSATDTQEHAEEAQPPAQPDTTLTAAPTPAAPAPKEGADPTADPAHLAKPDQELGQNPDKSPVPSAAAPTAETPTAQPTAAALQNDTSATVAEPPRQAPPSAAPDTDTQAEPATAADEQPPSAAAVPEAHATAAGPSEPTNTATATPDGAPSDHDHSAKATKDTPPPLKPGEVGHVLVFTSRPVGATLTVEKQTLVTPAELNVGAMPQRVRVYAEKEGFEPASAWIDNATEFHKVGDVMRREVHMVLRPLPAAPAKPPAATR